MISVRNLPLIWFPSSLLVIDPARYSQVRAHTENFPIRKHSFELVLGLLPDSSSRALNLNFQKTFREFRREHYNLIILAASVNPSKPSFSCLGETTKALEAMVGSLPGSGAVSISGPL
jgi:hypothetical protein